jgi:hypothetical protein
MGELPSAWHVTRLALRRRIPLRHALWSLTLAAVWRRHGGAVEIAGFVPGLRPAESPSCSEHCWELGLGGVEPADLVAALGRAGLDIEREYRPTRNPYHHFFVATRAAGEG